jgi:hypothetical protein
VLLALTQAGASREDSYRLVQRNGMKTWDEGGKLVDHLKADEGVTALLSDAQIEACFDEAYHFKHVDTIFDRVFGACRETPMGYTRSKRMWDAACCSPETLTRIRSLSSSILARRIRPRRD